ncbi:MAG TPA: hypothetical protein VIE65_09245 [Methylobacter sp.]|jgi:hypothetical protein
MIDRALGIAGIAFTIIGFAVPFMFREIDRRLAWSGFIFGVLLLGAAATTAFLPGRDAQAISSPQLAQNVTSYRQQGGITAGIVNIGPQRLAFSPEIGRELLAKMPTKKNIDMISVGSTTDQNVATDFQNFLQQNGYIVFRKTVGMLVPPPGQKMSFADVGDEYILTIAPSAN